MNAQQVFPAAGKSLADQRWLVVALVFLFFPVGLYLLWKSSAFSAKVKWAIVAVFVGSMLVLGAVAPKKPEPPAGQPSADAAVGAKQGVAKQVEPVKQSAPPGLSEKDYAEAAAAPEDYTNVIRPLVTADKRLYKWCGVLEKADVDPVLSSLVIALGGKSHRFMVLYGNDARKVDAFGGQLRMGGTVCAAGQYVGNHDYTTVIGAQRTMPILVASIIYN